jgi:MptA/FolE2 family GTP cyclohydrolase
VRGRAAERLAEAGYGSDEVDRILDLVPIATHNQRGRGTLLVGTAEELDAEELVAIVEESMSAPVYELLKRPDELFVVEHAHLRPRFVEDSVRVALKGLLDTHPGLSDSRRSTTTTSWRSGTERSASCGPSSTAARPDRRRRSRPGSTPPR